MSLKVQALGPIPQATVAVARAAFPKGNTYLMLRDQLGTLFSDAEFADLFPSRGQPALAPWRLAVITVMQFAENLSDRQAADAVRARIDWKYLLGLELTDAGFDFSVLCEFRKRLLEHQAEARLLDGLLERCRTLGLVKGGGQQRTDSTAVLAAIRELNRLELVAETLRAALNQLAQAAPQWLQSWVPEEWYPRYGRRIEDGRLPRTADERREYAETVGSDGFVLLDRLAQAPELAELASVEILRCVWQRHYERVADAPGQVRYKNKQELARAAEATESPYDPDCRFRNKNGYCWLGYMTHYTETCEPKQVNLITHVTTTPATTHEVTCTAAIHHALAEKQLCPNEHLVDAAYIDAPLLVHSQVEHNITLFGPARGNPSWQNKVEGGYSMDQFEIDWQARQARCPQGQVSSSWHERTDANGKPFTLVAFAKKTCQSCDHRARCTRAKDQGRLLQLQATEQEYQALQAARERFASQEGRAQYRQRAGVEGTVSQAVRAFGARTTRYRGLAKTHLQQVATAAAINLARLVDHWNGVPKAETRTSRFAALAKAA